MISNSVRFALLTGVTTLSLAGHAALAADRAATTKAPSTARNDVAASPFEGEIIVTATKRSERLQEVPASVSVVTATDLTKQGAVRFADYANQVPGLTLTSGRTGNTQVTLRGITTGASQPGSTTSFYVDEAPIGSVNAYTGGNGITPDLDPSDLAQVEVLKGPQGTLYGAGAVGGLLKFTTAAPNLSEFQGSASAGLTSVAGGDVGYSVRGMVNIPLATDKIAFHASGFYRHDPGYIDNVNPLFDRKNINDAKVRGGRAVLSVKFAPHVRLDLSALGQDTSTGGLNTVDVDAVTQKPVYGDLKQNSYVRQYGWLRLRVYNATLHADVGRINLVSSTTYQRIYFREIGDGTRTYGALFGALTATPNLGARLDTIKHTSRWSEEARASSNGLLGGLLDVQAGFYWTRESDQNRIPNIDTFSTLTGAAIPSSSLALLPGTPFAITSPHGIAVASINSTYEEYSGYGNIRLHLGAKFDVLAGVRYSHEHQTFVQDYAGLLVLVSSGLAQERLIAPGQESHNVATWLVSPRFRFSDNAMVYGRVATGYRPGGPNPAPPTPAAAIPLTFQPDRLTQYELGFKGSTSDRKLTVDAALFYTDWNDIQIQTSGGGFNYLVNGGKARSKGGELTLRYQPLQGLLLGANLNYTDAKLTTAAPAAGGLKGDRLPYVPHWAGSLTVDYAIPLNEATRLTLGGNANYTGARVSDYTNKAPKRLGAYTTFDLHAGLDFGRWGLSVFAKNLTDKRAILVTGSEGLAPSNTPGALYSAAVIQPRTIGAEASIKF